MGMYFQWVRRFGTQNGAQNRVQNRPQNRVQKRKTDIQSWVLIRLFSASFGPQNGREMAIRRTKRADFLEHFEARELSYPIMMFPGTFWKVQNLEISVPEAPIFRRIKLEFSKIVLREPS